MDFAWIVAWITVRKNGSGTLNVLTSWPNLRCSEPIQAAICNGPGLRHLLCLLQPARMDHGETATVAAAAKVLSNLVNEGSLVCARWKRKNRDLLRGEHLDSARGQFTSKETVSRLLELIKYEWEVDRFDDLGLLESLADILLQAVAEDGNIHKKWDWILQAHRWYLQKTMAKLP